MGKSFLKVKLAVAWCSSTWDLKRKYLMDVICQCGFLLVRHGFYVVVCIDD